MAWSVLFRAVHHPAVQGSTGGIVAQVVASLHDTGHFHAEPNDDMLLAGALVLLQRRCVTLTTALKRWVDSNDSFVSYE